MGAGFYGGFGGTKGSNGNNSQSSIDKNVSRMSRAFPLTTSGYFGNKGKNVRIIASLSPEKTANDFYTKIKAGGKSEPLKNGHGSMTTLGDGTVIVYRPVTSTTGSPAVNIKVIRPGKVKSQKIHFVKEER